MSSTSTPSQPSSAPGPRNPPSPPSNADTAQPPPEDHTQENTDDTANPDESMPKPKPKSKSPSPNSSSSTPPRYRLLVTAGPSPSPSTHTTQVINSSSPQSPPLTLSTPSLTLTLSIRIRSYTGLPSSSPSTHPYFSTPQHKSDQYSIAFAFVPKHDIKGEDLVFGNDFDRPIRDRLPPGFGAALKVVRWWIDPGLEGDPYAEKPGLFGKALSSWNVVSVGERVDGEEDKGEVPRGVREGFHEEVVHEGGIGSGEEVRKKLGIPSDAAARKKYFLTPENLKNFTFEKGRLYRSDFGNPYLNFNDFSLQLPYWGSLNVIKYVDGKTHELRYTLKNKATGEVYCVVLFTLLFGEELARAEEEDARTGTVTLRAGDREGDGADATHVQVGGDERRNGGDESPGPDDVD
ncbi:MAG: hypothetical protein Q9160_002591 [Pyrenula sp. 1 TL-2023]